MKNALSIIILGFVLLLFTIYAIITFNQDSSAQEKRLRKQIELIGKVRFKGKVINKKIYQYGGRDYYLICIKLDYSNTKNLYVYNDFCGIKIKNGIATMSAGGYDPVFGATLYIEVNMNNDNHVKDIYKDGSNQIYVGSMDPFGMSEKDLNTCN